MESCRVKYSRTNLAAPVRGYALLDTDEGVQIYQILERSANRYQSSIFTDVSTLHNNALSQLLLSKLEHYLNPSEQSCTCTTQKYQACECGQYGKPLLSFR